ncbi:TetR/AcrR family transcriptional regulator [Microvirga terricola]|uniref:TetR/AcrR family transcriptional regulator n=1 Tax=Microvirga terricola TaxID=2719797 RepID=A0ABX0VC47_9HYPH|nr:TetR/AcrR family transcriptional regulator [Microvirga terricola]NIX76275.1 TetR/AcrR family transcriptional regulator [Microvirga terricola]
MTSEAHAKRKAIVEALMDLASRRRWSEIEIKDIAQAANVSLAEFSDAFPSKGAVLGAFSRQIDRTVLEGTTDELAKEPPRDRIFDVMMRRLDALAPYKPALRRIAKELRFDPLSLAALSRAAINSQRFMLSAANISTEGPLGALKLQGAALVFAKTLDTWLHDDDPSQAKTMARLDKELRRGERMLERADDCRRLTAPFRAFGRAVIESCGPHRRRGRTKDGEAENPAATI